MSLDRKGGQGATLGSTRQTMAKSLQVVQGERQAVGGYNIWE